MSTATVQRRTLAVLAGTQVLGGLGIGANVAAGGLIAVEIAGSEGVAGVAATTTVLGAAVAALPLASLTSSRGRRAGLAAGFVVGALGTLLVVLGAARASLPLVLAGTFLAGSATASGLQSRFGATDLASPDHAARALSLVVWATTVGAVLGPNLAEPGARIGRALDIPDLAGAYVISTGAFLAATALTWWGLRPDPLLLARARLGAAGPPSPTDHQSGRLRGARRAVRSHPDARLGIAAVAVGHAAMVGVMVMTPIHLAHADVSVRIIGLTISGHILGMYALSPLVGAASDRIGRRPVVLVGAALLLAAAACVGTAPADRSLVVAAGLFLLGLGWSCTLVAGSALLTESVPEGSRQDVQGLSDLAMNLSGAVAGAVAGGVVAVWSYGWLTLLAGLLVAPLAIRSRPA